MSLTTTSRPGIRTRALLRWPAALLAGAGIKWVFGNGQATASLDYPSLVDRTSIPDASRHTLAAYNRDSTAYEEIRLDTILGSVVGDGYRGQGDVGGAPAAILNTDRTVGLTGALTAPRSWPLPAANSVPGGREIVVADVANGVTAVNTLTLTATGADTIDGAGSFVLNVGRGAVVLRSDGVSKWKIVGATTPASVSTTFLAAAADKLAYYTSATATALTALTAFGRSLIGAADAAAARATLGAIAIDGSNFGPIGRRNFANNPRMNIWQRGAGSFATNGAYTADRYVMVLVGGSGAVDRVSVTAGAYANAPAYALQQNVSGQTLASHIALIAHKLEGVRRFAGKRIIVSFMVRIAAGAGQIFVDIDQEFGTGGSPSATVTTSGGKTGALSGSWVRKWVALDVPSIAGKTVGTDGNDCLTVNFWNSAGSNFNARTGSLGLQTIAPQITDIQIEEVVAGYGDNPTPFQYIGEAADAAECGRFFRSFPKLFVSGTGSATNSATINLFDSYSFEPMRIVPAVSITPITNTNAWQGATLDNVQIDSVTIGFSNSLANQQSWVAFSLLLSSEL